MDSIESPFTAGEIDEQLNGFRRQAPLRTPAVHAGRDSLSYDGHFANKAANRDKTILTALCLYGVTRSTDFNEESAMLERLEPSASENEEFPTVRRQRVSRTVKMVVANGRSWTLRPRTRWIEQTIKDVVPQAPSVTPSRNQVKMGTLIERRRKVVVDFTPATDSRIVRLPTRTQPVRPVRQSRRCAHLGCNTDFLVPSNAPNADMCQQHHKERVRAREQQVAAPSPQPKPQLSPQARKAKEQSIREAFVNRGVLLDGVTLSEHSTANQKMLVWSGGSLTIHVGTKKRGTFRPQHGRRQYA